MDPNSLFIAIAALILLAVTSTRFAVESRDGGPPSERRWPPRGSSRTDP